MESSQFYINKNIEFLVNKRIYEYDINKAGVTALKNSGIISEDTYNLWVNTSKERTVKTVGRNLAQEMDIINEKIAKAVDTFLRINEVPKSAVISKKRDAVFIYNNRVLKNEVDGFTFTIKHKYTSYFKFDDFELYYNSLKNKLDIKGLKEEFYELHLLIPYIKKCIKMFEQLDQRYLSYSEVYSYVHTLRTKYVTCKLPTGCYRELATGSPFLVYDKKENQTMECAMIPKGENYSLVINYNFVKFIIPFINLLSQYSFSTFRR